MKYMKEALLITLIALSGLGNAAAAQRLKVVTTMSTFADLAKSVGGDYIEVSSIASPKFNPHFIEPKPSDVVKVKRADLLIHAGLDLELWRGPLLDAAANREVMPGGPRELDLSRSIALLEVPDHPVNRAEGDIHLYGNPHYWTDPENGKIIAQEIGEKLCAIDPDHAGEYRRNLQALLARLDEHMTQWHVRLSPLKGQEVVGYHNEWPYLMRFADLTMSQFLEPKPGIPPTPKQIEFLEHYVGEKHIRAIAQSTYFKQQAANAVATHTGAKVIELCQNVGEVPACSDYVAMIDYNVNQLIGALSHE